MWMTTLTANPFGDQGLTYYWYMLKWKILDARWIRSYSITIREANVQAKTILNIDSSRREVLDGEIDDFARKETRF